MENENFHNGISRELGGINENLKTIHNEIRGLKKQVTIANGRTRKLEDWKLKVDTRVGVISGLVSGAIAIVVWVISNVLK